MKIIKLTITFLILLASLNACSSISEGIGASKKKGNEEFLVEKKAPLVLPPSFGELPKPGTKIKENSTSLEVINSSLTEIIKNDSKECIN